MTKDEIVEQYGEEAVNAHIELFGDFDAMHFVDSYEGQFDTDEEYAQSQVDGIMGVNSNDWIWTYIDWNDVARDLMTDASEQNHHYFRG